MTPRNLPDNDRLIDLLIERATQGLSDGDAAELARLLAQYPDFDPDTLDHAVATIDCALSEPIPGELPAALLARIRADANRATAVAQPPAAAPRFAALGWLAAAASLFIAAALWLNARPIQPTPPPPAERRETLLAKAPDLVKVAWQSQDPRFAGVTGDAVWSTGRQEGYMRLKGMPANTPTAQQYQLWIVDPARDKNPVDGGVFDVPAGAAEVIIPMNAKLAVGKPAAFAITLEKPGGVVVSAGPLLVVAPVKS